MFWKQKADEEYRKFIGKRIVLLNRPIEFVVSSSWLCPECSKPNMCKWHNFVYFKWLGRLSFRIADRVD